MKIVKLDINEDSFLSGLDAVALVEYPAIEEDFFMFSKQNFEDTFNDYPKAAVDAAKRGIELNKENDNKCATQVGKVRAQQFVNGEKMSLDTIRRMRAFLIRQKDNYELARERKDYNACGYISYLLWGGEAALPWAEKKLRQAGEEFKEFSQDEIETLVLEDIVKTHLFSADVSALPNYIDQLPDETQEAILDKLQLVGETMEGWIEIEPEEAIKEAFASIKSTPDEPSIADFGKIAVRYRYTGPYDSRNRKFCRQLMTLDLVFRREDINRLAITGANEEFGVYDVFAYKGSYNCRHYWQEVFYRRDDSINNNSEPMAISQRILDGTTVNTPVIQRNGRADREIFSALDDKQMLIGPLMTPNKLIKRLDDNGDEYFVYFDEQTIEKIAYKFMADKLVDRVNIEHDSNDMVDDAYLVETWIVKDPEKDKALFYGYAPKKGQWFGMYKIKNKQVWDEYVKTGKVKGFSVEGFFNDKLLTNASTRKKS